MGEWEGVRRGIHINGGESVLEGVVVVVVVVLMVVLMVVMEALAVEVGVVMEGVDRMVMVLKPFVYMDCLGVSTLLHMDSLVSFSCLVVVVLVAELSVCISL